MIKYVFLSIFISIFILSAYVYVNYVSYIDPKENENFLSFENNWVNVCFSSEYEIPNIAINDYTKEMCWNEDEVPIGVLFITYILENGNCDKQKIKANLRNKGNSETLCFVRDNIISAKIDKSDKVIEFELKGRNNE